METWVGEICGGKRRIFGGGETGGSHGAMHWQYIPSQTAWKEEN